MKVPPIPFPPVTFSRRLPFMTLFSPSHRHNITEKVVLYSFNYLFITSLNLPPQSLNSSHRHTRAPRVFTAHNSCVTLLPERLNHYQGNVNSSPTHLITDTQTDRQDLGAKKLMATRSPIKTTRLSGRRNSEERHHYLRTRPTEGGSLTTIPAAGGFQMAVKMS